MLAAVKQAMEFFNAIALQTDRTSYLDAQLPVLLLLSDGEPTDDDTGGLKIASRIKELKRARVPGIVACCYISGTADDITDKTLYARPRPGWSDAATLMFDFASEVPPPETAPRLHRALVDNGWTIENPRAGQGRGRLFVHANNSDGLADFFSRIGAQLVHTA
eukprot:m.24048 g.24048  ORF g.24048 m.24048 type:complete len:163 (+) comp3967_c0_seq2:1159-1647(+)